jgi:hypothetical protein
VAGLEMNLPGYLPFARTAHGNSLKFPPLSRIFPEFSRFIPEKFPFDAWLYFTVRPMRLSHFRPDAKSNSIFDTIRALSYPLRNKYENFKLLPKRLFFCPVCVLIEMRQLK